MAAFVPPPLPPKPAPRTLTREDVVAVEAQVRALCAATPRGAAGWDQILVAVPMEVMPPALVEEALETLMSSGILYEPTLGTLRVAE